MGGDKEGTKLELRNRVDYKHIEYNPDAVQIPRLVAGRACIVILSLSFAHSVRL
jgi:hypothetical protein